MMNMKGKIFSYCFVGPGTWPTQAKKKTQKLQFLPSVVPSRGEEVKKRVTDQRGEQMNFQQCVHEVLGPDDLPHPSAPFTLGE